MSENAPTYTDQPKPSTGNNLLLVFIVILLALLLVVSAIQLVFTIQQNTARAERAEAALQLVDSQQSMILDLTNGYQEAAYEDESVETIYQQQLIASESILSALQLIATQNTQVIELLATTP